MLNFILNLLFPPKCPVCGKRVENSGEVCEVCLNKILNVRHLSTTSDLVFDILTLTNYKEGARGIIRELKFENKTSRVKNINHILEKADNLIQDYPKNIIAVFVPISKKRMEERGFNQVELMFKDWLQKRNIIYKNILIREKATEHQYSLNPQERKANVKDAFKATVKLNGEDILLLDDIYTTGATVFECVKTLKAAGAGKIYVLAFSSNKS